MGNVPDRVFQDLHPVGALHQTVELGADLVLTGGRYLVVVYFHFHALLLERQTHGIADVLQRVNRWHREIATLDRGAVSHVAAFELLAGGPRRLLGRDLDEAAGHVDVPGHAIEYEELGLRPEISRVADSRGLQIGLGALGDGTRITIVALAVGRLDDVTGNVQRYFIGERVEARGIRAGHQQHV